MRTITTLLFIVTIFQIATYLKVIYVNDSFWKLKYLKEGAIVLIIAFASELVAGAIWADVYSNEMSNQAANTDARVSELFFLWSLLLWTTFSIYQYWRRQRVRNKTHRQDYNQTNAPLASSLANLILGRVVMIVSFIASVLGILSFYFDYLR